MFHPVDLPMERGWVGRIDGDRVVHLAAQTLESFFTGGGKAREHAVYPLERVQLLAPVLHPPSVRVFEGETTFEFANPAAVLGPHTEVAHRSIDDWLPLSLRPRIAAVIGEGGRIAGFANLADWRAPLPPPKDRDFALGLGPFVVTLDEAPRAPTATVSVFDDEVLSAPADAFDWEAARDFAAEGTALRAGDLLAGPALGVVEGIEPATTVDVALDGLGTLRQFVHPPVEM
jgi:hypothetical protein